MKALIVIDVQNDFLPGGALAVEDGDLIVPVINQLISQFELVIATQDWHPRNHVSFADNHQNKKPFDIIEHQGQEQILWPRHCVQNTHGAQFHAELDDLHFETIFRKGTHFNIDSYSGFYDNAHQKCTGLAGYLNEKNVQTLYFCGLAIDVCVKFSILDAMKLGYECILVEDASKPIDYNNYDKLKKSLKDKGVLILQSQQILD